MTVYFVVYILSSFLSYRYSVEKNKNIAYILKLLLFLTLFLPLALRYNIGTDYKNYFKLIRFDVNPSLGRWSSFELGWHPILWIIKTFNLDIHLFFVITSFFSVYFVLKIVDKKTSFYAILIYVSTLFLDSFSLVRQAFAAILAVYGFKLYFDTGKKIKLIFVLVSVLFHNSMALLLLLTPLVIYMKKRKDFKTTTWFVIFIFSFLFFSIVNIPAILFRIISSSIFGNSSSYFSDSLYGSATQLGSGLGVLLKEMCIVSFLFFMTKTTKFGVKNEVYAISNTMLLFILVSYVFSTQITIMNRIPYIFTTFYLITVKSLFYSKSRYRKLGLYLVILIFTANFIVNIIKNPSSGFGGLGITPYTWIFER